jgi:mono/diheme cytochrome c family protein
MSLRAGTVPFTLLVILTLVACSRHGGAHGRAAASPNVPGADISRGKAIYAQQCAACHGAGGSGGEIGPSLADERDRRSYQAVRDIILDPQPPMPKLYPSRMTKADVRDVSAYVETL